LKMEDKLDQIGQPPPNEKRAVKDAVEGGNDMMQNEDNIAALDKSTEMVKDSALIDSEAGSKQTHKDNTTRKDKPPILTVESVRTLLEHRFHMILSKKASDSNFLKYLMISKVFFNVARRYPIFCLSVGYRSEDDMLRCKNLPRFKLSIIKGILKGSSGIILSYQKMNSLLSMLKPNHFFMVFGNSKVSDEIVMEAIGHLDFVDGKIALALSGDFQTELSLLFDQFSRRKLDYLQCSPDFLTRSGVKLKIGHYGTKLPINNVQLHKILSHNPDSFACSIDGNFIADANSNEAASLQRLDRCDSLKWLHVTCNRHYPSLMAFIDVIKGKCSKFKELSIYVVITRDNDHNMPCVSAADEILEHLVYAKGKIQEIVEKCRPLASNLKISSTVPMVYNSDDEFSYDWIERAKTMDWFKDAIHDETLAQGVNRSFNVCQVRSKFVDGFLELDNKSKVYRFIDNE